MPIHQITGLYPIVRQAAVNALGQMRNDNAKIIGYLLPLLTASDPAIIRSVAGAIVNLDVDRTGFGQHIEGLLVKHEGVRGQAIDERVDALIFALQQLVEKV
jgi:hypothetical protein